MRVIEWPNDEGGLLNFFPVAMASIAIDLLYYQNAKSSVLRARPHPLILTQKDV